MPVLASVGDIGAEDVSGNLCTARGRGGGDLLGLLSVLRLDAEEIDLLRAERLSGVWVGLEDPDRYWLCRGRGAKPARPRSLGVGLPVTKEPESRRRRLITGEGDPDLERP